MNATIEQLKFELALVNQQIGDLNAFANMTTTKQERADIMGQWAELSQQRISLIMRIRKC